jgi:carbonic anhydrase/acetyltransferase-like protein (isoleucine patch superfamily)
MNKKYELIEHNNPSIPKHLKQIKALVDIPEKAVKKGDLGGCIEREESLSHEGNAWVSGNALVFENAQVSGNALVSGNARVSGNALVFGDAFVYGNAQVSGNARVHGNARVYGDAWVSGNAELKSPNNLIYLQLVWQYNVTITPQNVSIGCKLFTYDQIRNITEKQAIDMGMKKEDIYFYRDMIFTTLNRMENNK